MPNPTPDAFEDAAEPAPAAPAPGPVTIQVAPDGFVTIRVTPPARPAFEGETGEVALEGFTERGFWRRDPPPADAETGTREPGPLQETVDKLQAALKTLGEKVADFAKDVTTLEVRTFVSDRLDRLDDAFFTTAEPRALTRIRLDGKTEVVVPLDEGQLDSALWRIHAETVAQAQAHREAMLRTVLDLARGIAPTVK